MEERLKLKPPKLMPVPRRDDVRGTYAWHPGMKEYEGEDGKIYTPVLRVSKSSWSTFTFCEQQYFIKYVLGVKEPQNDAMLRGTNVHDAYEYILDHLLDIHEAHAIRDHQGEEALHDYFQSLIPKSQVSKGWDDEIAQHTGNPYLLDEEKHLARLMTAEAKRFLHSDPVYFKPLGNERTVDAFVEIEVNGVVVPVHLTGIIDRLFVDPNGDLHVHELKTGLWKDKKTKYEGMAGEMAYYVYLLRKSDDPELGGCNVKYWGWDHTKGLEGEPDRIYRFVERVQTGIVSSMIANLKAMVSAHLRYKGDFNGKDFAVKPPNAERYICDPWCKVDGYCPKNDRYLMPKDMRAKAEGN